MRWRQQLRTDGGGGFSACLRGGVPTPPHYGELRAWIVCRDPQSNAKNAAQRLRPPERNLTEVSQPTGGQGGESRKSFIADQPEEPSSVGEGFG